MTRTVQLGLWPSLSSTKSEAVKLPFFCCGSYVIFSKWSVSDLRNDFEMNVALKPLNKTVKIY